MASMYEQIVEQIRVELAKGDRREAERLAANYERNLGLDRHRLIKAAE